MRQARAIRPTADVRHCAGCAAPIFIQPGRHWAHVYPDDDAHCPRNAPLPQVVSMCYTGVACPTCNARPGERCRTVSTRRPVPGESHSARFHAWRAAGYPADPVAHEPFSVRERR